MSYSDQVASHEKIVRDLKELKELKKQIKKATEELDEFGGEMIFNGAPPSFVHRFRELRKAIGF